MLLRKERSYAEVYNDLDGEIVNLFRVARDHGDELLEMVRLTPFARDEFDESYEQSQDPIEQARRTMVRCGMGFGSSALNTKHKTGFRGSATRSGTHPATDWRNSTENLRIVIERLRGVIIENRPAQQVCEYHDGATTLHYLDPPYVHDTRTWTNAKDAYRFEMSNDDHREFSRWAHALRGSVIISGYRCDLYDELFGDFETVECDALADKAVKRTEVLWMNAACMNRRDVRDLFSV